MAYTKQNWVDAPDGSTPIYAAQLNHIEDGVAGIYTTLSAHAAPTWVQPTLMGTLDAIAHPIQLIVKYASGWAIDPALQADSHFGWLFVGGTLSTPPPTTAGPQAWDIPA